MGKLITITDPQNQHRPASIKLQKGIWEIKPNIHLDAAAYLDDRGIVELLSALDNTITRVEMEIMTIDDYEEPERGVMVMHSNGKVAVGVCFTDNIVPAIILRETKGVIAEISAARDEAK